MHSDAPILAFAAATHSLLWPFFYLSGSIHDMSQHLALAAVLAASLALLAWIQLAHASYCTWRSYSMAAYQLGNSVMLTLARIDAPFNHPPSAGFWGGVTDCVRVVTGCRCHIPLFLGAGLPLDLVPQMAVQALSVASVIALSTDCKSKFLNSSLMQQRFADFHSGMSVGTLGHFIPHLTGGTTHCQCTAALNFVLISLGWMLPIYLVARQSYQTARAAVRQQRRLTLSQRAADFLCGDVLWTGGPLETQVMAWYLLAALCWLVGAEAAAVFAS